MSEVRSQWSVVSGQWSAVRSEKTMAEKTGKTLGSSQMKKKLTHHQTDIIKKNGEIIRLYPLTEMETKVAKLLVSKAMSNQEAADELGKSINTVQSHRICLMKKLKTKNAIELTKKIIKMGLAKL